MKLTREEFKNHDFGEGTVTEITLKFGDGSEVTIEGAHVEEETNDGAILFVEHEEGVLAIGAASPRMLNHIKRTQIPSILRQLGAEDEAELADIGAFFEMMMGEPK